MRGTPSPQFPYISACLANGTSKSRPPVSTTNRRGRSSLALVKGPIYVSVTENRAGGRLGVAAYNPDTKDFHLFNFVDSSYISLQTLLQDLNPTEILIEVSTTKSLQEAVVTACREATVFTVNKSCFFGGSQPFRRLSDDISKLKSISEKEECLSAFAALVQYTEHEMKTRLPPRSLSISIHTKPLSIQCPLCEKLGEKCELTSVKEIQDHFHHYHWQVHGYACHCCGATFPTIGDLKNGHSDCSEWTAWRESRNQLETTLRMRFARQLLCCSDCGWHVALSSRVETTANDETAIREQRIREEATMKYLQSFFSHHCNDRLLSMVVYFPADPRAKVDSIKLFVTSTSGGDPLAPCAHCDPPETFRDPSEANEHYRELHVDKALVCGECDAKATTHYILEQHLMSHIHDNSSYFADYLSNTARIFPPPSNLSDAPRCGWKVGQKGELALGGIFGGVEKGLDLVDPEDDVREAKARLIMRRKREGKPTIDIGYENATVVFESTKARRVREKLMHEYGDCEFMAGWKNGAIWLTDEEAEKFREWMEYWESEEGKTEGGPAKTIEVDLSPSLLRIPTVEVELSLSEQINPIDGFILNENIFYCFECDTIHKEKEANEHLEPPGQQPSKCAGDTEHIERDPVLNVNMFTLFRPSTSPPSSALPCPRCPRMLCSITGLRVHLMVAHGKFVPCTPIDSEVVADSQAFKVDIRVATEKKKEEKGEGKRRGAKRRRDSEETEEEGVKRDKTRGDEESDVASSSSVRRGRVGIAAKRREETDKKARMSEETSDEEEEEMMEYGFKMEIEEEWDQFGRAAAGMDEGAKEDHREESMEQMAVDKPDEDDIIVIDDELDEPKKKTGKEMEKMDVNKADDDDIIVVKNLAESKKKTGTVVRVFTPAEGEDDELCIVKEIDKPGSLIAPAAVAKREQKHGCPKCSEKFITRVSLEIHLSTAHRHDAGQSTIQEELGIPVTTRLFICKICCLAFSTQETRSVHVAQHGTAPLRCECCSGAAAAENVLEDHRDRRAKGQLAYICGECKLSFNSDVGLHEHSRDVHSTTLFYFCKNCDMGSTDGPIMYQHYLGGCSKASFRLAMDLPEDLINWMGVVPASLLHYQPNHLATVKIAIAEQPDRFVRPSLCNHRSLLIVNERRVSCDECKCLQHIQTYEAQKRANGQTWDPVVKEGPAAAPFAVLRSVFQQMAKYGAERRIEEKQAAKKAQIVQRVMSSSQVSTSSLSLCAAGETAASSSSTAINSSQQVLHRMDDRLSAASQQRVLQRTTTESTVEKSSPGSALTAARAANGMIGSSSAHSASGSRAVQILPVPRTVSTTGRGGGAVTRGRSSQLINPARAITLGGPSRHSVNGTPSSALPSARSTNGGMMGNNLASPASGSRAAVNLPSQRTVSTTGRGGGRRATRGRGSQVITPGRATTMAAAGALYQMATTSNAPSMMRGGHLLPPIVSGRGASPIVVAQAASRNNPGAGVGMPNRTMADMSRDVENAAVARRRSSTSARPPLVRTHTQSSQAGTATTAKKAMPPPSLNH